MTVEKRAEGKMETLKKEIDSLKAEIKEKDILLEKLQKSVI